MSFRVPIEAVNRQEKASEDLMMIASMWFFVKLLISNATSLDHKSAKPPLHPELGTISPFEKLRLKYIFSMRFSFAFVSIKKTMVGFQRRT